MSVSASAGLSEPSKAGVEKNITRLIVATSIGNALEWYDITVYGYFAVYVSKAFFPSDNQATSLLLTFGTFGLAYLARPIGGVVLGAYADRRGRKGSLLISIVLMTLGTVAVAVMPTYGTIGLVAPVAVIAARLVQGFSAGGEPGGGPVPPARCRASGSRRPWTAGLAALWRFRTEAFSRGPPRADATASPFRRRQSVRFKMMIDSVYVTPAMPASTAGSPIGAPRSA